MNRTQEIIKLKEDMSNLLYRIESIEAKFASIVEKQADLMKFQIALAELLKEKD